MKVLPAEYTVQILRSIKEIEEIRPIWEEKQRHPGGDLDVFINSINSKEERICPYIILIFLNQKPEAIIAGIIEKKKIGINLYYKKLPGPLLRVLTLVPERIFGNENFNCSDIFINVLITLLNKNEIDLVSFDYVDTDSQLFSLAFKKSGFFYRDYSPQMITHWKTNLPGTIDELFINIRSKQRHELFRKERRIQKEYNTNITFVCYKNEQEINRLALDVEKVTENSFQGIFGFDLKKNSENLNFLSIAAKKGWLRGHILYIDEIPCAFYICLVYKDVFYFRNSAFNESYKYYSPGVVLLKHILENIYQHEKNVREIDWGIGDKKFMKHLGNYSEKVASIYIFPATFYGLWLNFSKAFFVLIKTCVKTILIKFGLKDKVMSYWRQRLVKKYLAN